MNEIICPFLAQSPEIHPEAFVASGAELVGAVTLEAYSSIWHHCVLRADLEQIRVGEGSNIQDGSVIHLASDHGTRVGRYVTCGHRVLLHACEIDDEVLVGMGSIVMDGAFVGSRSIIGAGSLIRKGQRIPPGSLVMGSPGKVIRKLDREEQRSIRGWAEKYIRVAREHRLKLGESKRSAGGVAPENGS